ncbi:MAG: alpha/beta hydrolase [Alphaproteobacteria bacterium]|nr:alpha/beta hydrolase [Alphaproteobacteria bacterium]MBU1515171.1 alpha/beta hydrolase [Alphaproteobacteria bacterium]MBU2092301.1 alpha/beta hydrolase [Alphaproteobacteria bacterium]MBU2152895.1 alpha/beta hydrolase [Alphaproteobacteria bacterium]MBU2305726.1 alpha/beta hydrolase [Alphaproteobacteria bacterium]
MASLPVIAMAAALAAGAPAPLPSTSATTTYYREMVDGVGVFYREAGPKDAPTLVLLHGYPSSSRMFEGLIPLLAVRYHVIAPDYPGFGQSDAPTPSQYAYTFDHLAQTIAGLLDQLDVEHCVFYLQDYGGPVGFRVMAARPARVRGLIVQNANAYDEGLGAKWAGIAQFWRDPASHQAQLDAFISLDGARQRHIAGSPNPQRYSPDAWIDEFAMLSRPGAREIQGALLYDYQTNVAAYPTWQAWMRTHRPPALILWGRYDPSFIVPGAEAYRRDLPEAELHLLEAGHFALDEGLDEAAGLVLHFLDRLPR